MGSAERARRVPTPVVQALGEGRSLTRELAAELLTHMPELGSAGEQRLLDTWVEQAADTLLALSDALEERLLELGSSLSEDERRAVPR
jgi:hypothetical protein